MRTSFGKNGAKTSNFYGIVERFDWWQSDVEDGRHTWVKYRSLGLSEARLHYLPGGTLFPFVSNQVP